MHEDDLHTTGRFNIPTCNKHMGYAGYPQSDNSNQENNATPGPSCPVKGKENHSDSSHHGSEWNNNCSNKPLCKHHGKKEIPRHEPSNLGNSSSSDDDYSPSEDDSESSSIESKSTQHGSCVHKLRKEKERRHFRKSDVGQMKEIIQTPPTPALVMTGDQTDRLIVITERKHVKIKSLDTIVHLLLNLCGTPKRDSNSSK
jgi:hypothetical protein